MQKINTLVALLGLSLLMSGVARSAENTGLGLSQVKAALVDAAMQQGVSVVSNAYVDSKGELIESSFFRSGAIVRGIRIAIWAWRFPGSEAEHTKRVKLGKRIAWLK